MFFLFSCSLSLFLPLSINDRCLFCGFIVRSSVLCGVNLFFFLLFISDSVRNDFGYIFFAQHFFFLRIIPLAVIRSNTFFFSLLLMLCLFLCFLWFLFAYLKHYLKAYGILMSRSKKNDFERRTTNNEMGNRNFFYPSSSLWISMQCMKSATEDKKKCETLPRSKEQQQTETKVVQFFADGRVFIFVDIILIRYTSDVWRSGTFDDNHYDKEGGMRGETKITHKL